MRAVTGDHVLFGEAIDVFRRAPIDRSLHIKGKSRSIVLTGFKIRNDWTLPGSTLLASREVDLGLATVAFISWVENPDTVGIVNPHNYGIALSAIISFATGRECQSTRDDYHCPKINPLDCELLQLGSRLPLRRSGPGSVRYNLSKSTLDEYESDIGKIIKLLHKVEYKHYLLLIRTMRTIQLSILSKRDDFGLGYLLLISAIEAVAQAAIPRKTCRETPEQEPKWAALAKDNSDWSELFDAYKDARGAKHYLTERYIKFINTYAPVECWPKLVQRQLNEVEDYDREQNRMPVPRPPLDGVHPEQLSNEEIQFILKNSYIHRSDFIHAGKQPPHQRPNGESLFFETVRNFEKNTTTQVPSYNLMLAIAQQSILSWALSLKTFK